MWKCCFKVAFDGDDDDDEIAGGAVGGKVGKNGKIGNETIYIPLKFSSS